MTGLEKTDLELCLEELGHKDMRLATEPRLRAGRADAACQHGLCRDDGGARPGLAEPCKPLTRALLQLERRGLRLRLILSGFKKVFDRDLPFMMAAQSAA